MQSTHDTVYRFTVSKRLLYYFLLSAQPPNVESVRKQIWLVHNRAELWGTEYSIVNLMFLRREFRRALSAHGVETIPEVHLQARTRVGVFKLPSKYFLLFEDLFIYNGDPPEWCMVFFVVSKQSCRVDNSYNKIWKLETKNIVVKIKMILKSKKKERF